MGFPALLHGSLFGLPLPTLMAETSCDMSARVYVCCRWRHLTCRCVRRTSRPRQSAWQLQRLLSTRRSLPQFRACNLEERCELGWRLMACGYVWEKVTKLAGEQGARVVLSGWAQRHAAREQTLGEMNSQNDRERTHEEYALSAARKRGSNSGLGAATGNFRCHKGSATVRGPEPANTNSTPPTGT
eukprot:360740-Chlamydomonas_euryale.AAC.7